MKNYSNIILNTLLDKYERSSLYKGENTVNVKIALKFSKDSLPDYFNEYKFELKDEINTQCLNLVERGYIKVIWKKYQEGNIIEKVELNLDYLEDVYKSLGRTKKSSFEEGAISILSPYINNDSWLGSFAVEMVDKLKSKSSIKKYFDIEDTVTMKDLLTALEALLKVEVEIPKRVLSIHLFKDSKRLEALESKLTRIMLDFGGFESDIDVLAECNVISNPGYVYLKGKGIFICNDGEIDLQALAGEIALGTALINSLEVKELKVKRVLTIENLTSFHTYEPKDELVIYLGGYHNTVRRKFLKKLYCYDSMVEFHHWGDIDLGGFRILNHLRQKTGIPFKSYLMDLETLERFIEFVKPIDNKGYLESLRELAEKEGFEEFVEVIGGMVEKRVRLEQEVVII